jgi:hypothetical protein
VPNVQWINSWWWAEELPETCRVSCQNKFVKLVHLFGFVIKKCVTSHGHMNAKSIDVLVIWRGLESAQLKDKERVHTLLWDL